MKAFLMHRDRDFDLLVEPSPDHDTLTQDLELSRLFAAMALGDTFLFEVARKAVLSSLEDVDAIRYRQEILRDCLEQPAIVREMYDLAVEAVRAEKKVWGFFSQSPDMILHRSIKVLEMFIRLLTSLRQTAVERGGGFRSEGFSNLFSMLARELDDGYVRALEDHLRELRFGRGVLVSAGLGRGNKGSGYVLRRPRRRGWWERISVELQSRYTIRVADRDENGIRALSELQGRGINLAANALAQSTDHILSFFSMLRVELGFYVGCLNLHRQLVEKGEPTCFPLPLPAHRRALAGRGLYDACLSLCLEPRVVGNEIAADGKSLVMITGANRGGKSTLLRSVGLAYLMMQSGMFVAAERFHASVCEGVFTHFKREEDATMTSGKLDEELSRMSRIAESITTNCVLLCNESFASTNEREGSEIARQIVRALLDTGVKVFFVTHMFDLAQGFHAQAIDGALFLRAEREPDGRRTFRLIEGEPLPTSFGEDVYRRIFGPPSGRPETGSADGL